MRTKIEFCGSLGELVGREVEVDLPPAGCTVAELRQLLCDRYPHAAADLARPSVRACVDQDIALEARHVRPGQEIAFFPPLSGG